MTRHVDRRQLDMWRRQDSRRAVLRRALPWAVFWGAFGLAGVMIGVALRLWG